MKATHVASAFVFGMALVTAAPVITFNPNTGFPAPPSALPAATIGWAFDISTGFTLNELGWYDQGGDGLGVAHQIAIWDTSKNLLVSGAVPSGTAAIIDGGFRMVFVPNTILGPGHYVIGGHTDPNGGDLLFVNSTQVVNPAVSWVSDRFSPPSTSLIFPGSQDGGNTSGIYGPMFGFVPVGSSIPEPSSFSLVGASLLAAFPGLQKTRKRHR